MAFETLNHGFLITGNILCENGDVIDVGEYIKSIMVRKRYLKDAFPLYVIDMSITENIRNIIRDNECKLSLKISYYTISETDINEENDGITEEGVIFDKEIRIYEKPFSAMAAKVETDDGESDETSVNKNAPYINYRISGIPEELVSVNDKVINQIYGDTKLINPIVNIISEFERDTFIQSPDNNEVYKNILIPPLSPINALHFLDDTYEIYNNGAALFVDTDKTYLYSPLSEEIDYKNSFHIEIKSIDRTAGSLETGKVLFDKDENIFKFTFNVPPSFINRKKILGNNIGSQTIFYSYDDNFNINKRSVSSTDNYEKVRYYWNSYGKKSTEDSLLNTKSIPISIKATNFNPALISPLTLFNVGSEYSEINGHYILDTLSYVFIRSSINHFRCITNIDLVKR